MQRTLLLIPHEIAGIPVFGIGWLLLAILAALALRLLLAKLQGGQPQGTGVVETLLRESPIWLLLSGIVWYVLPRVELTNVDGEPVGMAIRGYGVMLLLAVGSAVWLAAYRAKRQGFDPEIIYSVAPWVFAGGIIGARTFYVLQYRKDFISNTWKETVLKMLDFTGGGLVVYGSFIGGILAGSIYLHRKKLPWLKFGDVIVPCMFLGVFIGRLGCVMNGCCYGGVCEAPLPSVTFPPGSPPYMAQLDSGALIGIRATENLDPASGFRWIAEAVEEGSLADEQGVQVGDEFSIIAPDERYIRFEKKAGSESLALLMNLESNRKGGGAVPPITVPVADLPARSKAVYPTQIYSAINAFLLCLVLWFYWTVRKYDGEVFALMLILYSIGRFLMELIRIDEKGQLGTGLTISQLISVAMIILGISLLAFARRPTAKPVLPA